MKGVSMPGMSLPQRPRVSAGTLRRVRGRSVEEERIKQGGSNGGPGGAGAGMEAEDADSGINCT